MLKITNLSVNTKDTAKRVLDNINLELETGKIYAISGQNGSGKSTLAQVIIGNPEYVIGPISKITFYDQDLLTMLPEQRSHLGIFVSMQYPTEVPGVNLLNYLKLIVEFNRKAQKLDKLTAKQTLDLIHSKLELIGWSKDVLKRNLNEGMSGGERKKSEILQMLLLDPTLVILDEIDSGLDKEALETVVGIIKNFMNENKTLVVITHQQRILELLEPDSVIFLKGGKVVEKG
jgi:Fe-S cluster assembly ATP-binding protein